MTDSKLTAAVEELRSLRQMPEGGVWEVEVFGRDLRPELRLLANEYLREHPADDDEPITFTRLQRMGFGSETINGVSLIIDGCGGDPVELTIGYADTDTETEFIADVTQSNTNDHVLITGREFSVIGDIRRLCRALGIELKETR